VAAKESESSGQLVESVKMLNILQSVKITWELFLASGEKSASTQEIKGIDVSWKKLEETNPGCTELAVTFTPLS
jgi:hypothetical protein